MIENPIHNQYFNKKTKPNEDSEVYTRIAYLTVVDMNSIFDFLRKNCFPLYFLHSFIFSLLHFVTFPTKYFVCASNHSPTVLCSCKHAKYTQDEDLRTHPPSLPILQNQFIRRPRKAKFETATKQIDLFCSLHIRSSATTHSLYLGASPLKAFLFVNAQSVNKRKEINEKSERASEREREMRKKATKKDKQNEEKVWGYDGVVAEVSG